MSCHHSLHNIIGYKVRRTFFDGTPAVDAGEFVGGHTYADALACAKAVRAEPAHNGYAVVDPIYFCGCRGQG